MRSSPASLQFVTARQSKVALSLAAVIAALLPAIPGWAQSGYSLQGPYNPGPTMSRAPAAYQMQGAPPPGAGLSQGPGYNGYQMAPPPSSTPRPMRVTPPPAYQQRPVQAAPQQQPLYQPGQAQPYPYPAGAVQAPGYKPNTSSKKKTTSLKPAPLPSPSKKTPTSPHKITTSSASTSQLRADISDLKLNDRTQDKRLSALESRVGKGSSGSTGGSSDRYYHTVRSGDTLWRIADKHGTTPSAIKAANGMKSDVVIEGERLVIPGKKHVGYEPSYATVERSTSGYYTVRPGDTLSDIAAAHRVSTTSLANANGIRNSHMITVGQRLALPGTTVAYVPKKKSTPAPPPPAPRYVGTPRADAHLVSYYNSNSSSSSSGSSYRAPNDDGVVHTLIPAPGSGLDSRTSGSIPPPSGSRGITSYRVEPGDTIDSIAQSFNTSAAEVRALNKLSPGQMPVVNSELVVPSQGPISL